MVAEQHIHLVNPTLMFLVQPVLGLLALGGAQLGVAQARRQRQAVRALHVRPLGLDRHRRHHDDVAHVEHLGDKADGRVVGEF